MAESLFNRVRRLVSASIADLVESMEKSGGDAVMREAIREVDCALDDVRSELGRAALRKAQAQRQTRMTQDKLAELSEKARFALEQGRDELAEAAVSRQVDFEAQLPALAAAKAAAAAEEANYQSCVAALQARKREMEADLASFVAARAETGAHVGGMTAARSKRRWSSAWSAPRRPLIA